MTIGRSNRKFIVIACAFIAVIATAPLLRWFLPWAHDLSFHLTRIEGVADGLRAGQFPVRINPTFINGFGYADPIMYPPLFLYFPALLRLVGVPQLFAYQIFIFTLNFGTAAIAYLCAKRFFKRRDTALFAAAAYTLCLYRFICIYTRAALGEIIGMVFLPCILLGMYELLFGETRRALWLLIGGFAALVNAHVLSALIAAEVCAVIALFNLRRLFTKERLVILAQAVIATILLTLWVTVPMAHLGATPLRASSVGAITADNAAYPAELFSTFASARGLSKGLYEASSGMPLSVGGIFGAAILCYLFLRFFRRGELRRDIESGIRGAFFVALGALWVCSTLFPWRAVEHIPLIGGVINSIQFPWRYLGLASVGLAVVLTFCVEYFAGDAGRRRGNVFLVCGIVILLAVSPFVDSYIQDPNATTVLANSSDRAPVNVIGGQEYLRRGDTKEALEERGGDVVAEGLEVFNVKRDPLEFEVAFVDAENGSIELPLYYYPGYAASVGNISAGTGGVVRVEALSGNGLLHVFYRAPTAYRVAEIISILSLILLTLWFRRDILNHYNFRRKD